jgi:hypothetical protein
VGLYPTKGCGASPPNETPEFRLGWSAAFSSPFTHWFVVLCFPVTAAARFLSAMMDRVYRCPGTTFGFLFRHALLSIALLDVLSLRFCLSVYFSLSPLGIVFLLSGSLRLFGDSHATFDLAWQLPNEARIKRRRTFINQIKE